MMTLQDDLQTVFDRYVTAGVCLAILSSSDRLQDGVRRLKQVGAAPQAASGPGHWSGA